MFIEFELALQVELWEKNKKPLEICMLSKIAILKKMKITKQIELFDAIQESKIDFLELLYFAEI